MTTERRDLFDTFKKASVKKFLDWTGRKIALEQNDTTCWSYIKQIIDFVGKTG